MEEKYSHAEEQGAAKSSVSPAKQGLSKTKPAGESFARFDMARYNGGLSLGKDERLSRESVLNKLFSEGRSISQNGFTLVYLVVPLPAIYPAQAAFSVPKRHFKKAVDRNRVKRLMREAYRKNKIPLYEKLSQKEQQVAMMFIYKGKDLPEHEVVEKNVIDLVKKLLERLK